MSGAIQTKEIHKKTNNSVSCQFSNKANPDIHYKTTAAEIWSSLDGNIDSFISGIGTGGTISGVKVLKKKKYKDYGVEPEDSAVINGHEARASIQGIGAGLSQKI